MKDYNLKANKKNFDERKDADYTISWNTFEPVFFQQYFGELDAHYERLL